MDENLNISSRPISSKTSNASKLIVKPILKNDGFSKYLQLPSEFKVHNNFQLSAPAAEI